MKREFLDYLEDIINDMKNILDFTKGIEYKDFSEDAKTNHAVIRSIEIIGEAVKNIPVSVKEKYPDIPWKEIAGMRDKLIHEYFGVKLDLVWETIKEEIPVLKPRFEQIFEDCKE